MAWASVLSGGPAGGKDAPEPAASSREKVVIAAADTVEALAHFRANVSHAWVVTGTRVLPDGSVQTMVASSWGRTEERARAFYERLQDLGEQQALPGEWLGPRWTAEQLVFVRVEESL